PRADAPASGPVAPVRLRSACSCRLASLLLLVVLDDARGPDLGLVGVASELAQCSALPQEIPALVELDAKRIEPRLGGAARYASGVERVLLLHELLDPLEDPFVLRVLRHMPSFRNPSPRPLAGCRSHHRTLRGRETLKRPPLGAAPRRPGAGGRTNEVRACSARVPG